MHLVLSLSLSPAQNQIYDRACAKPSSYPTSFRAWSWAKLSSDIQLTFKLKPSPAQILSLLANWVEPAKLKKFCSSWHKLKQTSYTLSEIKLQRLVKIGQRRTKMSKFRSSEFFRAQAEPSLDFDFVIEPSQPSSNFSAKASSVHSAPTSMLFTSLLPTSLLLTSKGSKTTVHPAHCSHLTATSACRFSSGATQETPTRRRRPRPKRAPWTLCTRTPWSTTSPSTISSRCHYTPTWPSSTYTSGTTRSRWMFAPGKEWWVDRMMGAT